MVDFGESFAQIKKKSVRGLLKKRAKKYDSDESDPEDYGESENVKDKS